MFRKYSFEKEEKNVLFAFYNNLETNKNTLSILYYINFISELSRMDGRVNPFPLFNDAGIESTKTCSIIAVFTQCLLHPTIFQRIANVLVTNDLVCDAKRKSKLYISHPFPRCGPATARFGGPSRYFRHARDDVLISRWYRIDEPRN